MSDKELVHYSQAILSFLLGAVGVSSPDLPPPPSNMETDDLRASLIDLEVSIAARDERHDEI